MGANMTTIAGSSRSMLYARAALTHEICRINDLRRNITESSTIDEKIFFLRSLFEYLRNNHLYLCHHVGFRLAIIEKIKYARHISRDRRHQMHSHMIRMLVAITDVEKIICENPIKGAF
jgi:hypothetical protein